MNSETLSFWGLPSCLKWYSGGIYMEKKESLNPFWIGCFYTKEQAMKAYDIMERVVQLKYSWPKGETNWLKQNLSVLEQMYGNMDKVN